MIDDRGKPSGGASKDSEEEPVEVLADAIVTARRRPTRKLRVPHDPVPRRPEPEAAPPAPVAAESVSSAESSTAHAASMSDEDAARALEITTPDPASRLPLPRPLPLPNIELPTDVTSEEPSASVYSDTPETELVVEDEPISIPAPPRSKTPSMPARPRSVPPPPGGLSLPLPKPSAPPSAKAPSLPPPSKPGSVARVSVPAPKLEAPVDEYIDDLSETTLKAIPIVRSDVPPAEPEPRAVDAMSSVIVQDAASAAPDPETKSEPPQPRSEGPVSVSENPPAAAAQTDATSTAEPRDVAVVARRVRRKIRSVGTGSRPPPPRTEPPPEPEAPARAEVEISVPVPAVIVGLIDDDFAVPPVDAAEATTSGAPALRAPSVPSFESGTPPSGEAELLDSSDLAEETPEPEASIVVETADTTDAAEVIDEPTEEITIPDELIEADRSAPGSARATIPEKTRKPPAPPPAPPKAPAGEKPKPREEAATAATAPAKRKRRPWWEEIFNDDYFRTMPKYTPSQIKSEGDFIEQSLGVEKGAVVLDIACGDGRQAIELATRGYELIALDLSLPMLSRAADDAQDREAKLNFLHSDMREMEFADMFDAAYCTGTSFGFFEDEKNIDVAQRIHRALKTGGTFLLDVLNRDYAIQSQPAMTWFEADGCVCMEETSFDYIKSRLYVKRTMIMDDGRQKEYEANIRLYSLHELGLLFHNAGFRIIEVSGSYRTPGAFFGSASRQIIILAQKQKRPDSQPAIQISNASTQPNLPIVNPPTKE